MFVHESGAVDAPTIMKKTDSDGPGGRIGFDAVSGQYVDMIEAGIVDPAKVVRSEVENAVSVAAMIMLVETVVTESVQDGDRALPAARPA